MLVSGGAICPARVAAGGNARSDLEQHADHDFRPGESILTNAQPHAGKPLVVNLDVQEFFASTPYRLILRA